MGNQESISNDKYEVRKIQKSENKNPNKSIEQNNQHYNKHNINKQYNNQQYSRQQYNKQYNNQQYSSQQYNNQQYNNQQYSSQQYNNQQYNNQPYNNQQYSKQYNNQQYNNQQYNNDNDDDEHNYIDYPQTNGYSKKKNKQYSNEALISRNNLNDIYNKKNKGMIFDYPSNSNNELTEPKKNFDNIKFTPFNFNDEVNDFKKGIDEERNQFELEEKNRRNKFNKIEKEKKEFLDNQIKYFESNYNPWEILGLEYRDLDINNIKKAYKKNALKYHPDKAGDKYIDKFQLITQSYLYLLSKAEEKDNLKTKISKKVEKMDYEDNINQKVENIYVDKDKFDLNQFNKIFEKYKVPNVFDKGYSDLMKQDIKKDNDVIFGQNFNKDVFNTHFDNIKKKKVENNELINYQEPFALDTSLSNLNQSHLGMDDIEDFGAVNSNGLSYTDYKKAHVDETLLIDISKVKYKTYNSVEQLENERSKMSVNSWTDRDHQAEKRRQEEIDRKRMDKQKEYDDFIETHYNRLNQRLLVHK